MLTGAIHRCDSKIFFLPLHSAVSALFRAPNTSSLFRREVAGDEGATKHCMRVLWWYTGLVLPLCLPAFHTLNPHFRQSSRRSYLSRTDGPWPAVTFQGPALTQNTYATLPHTRPGVDSTAMLREQGRLRVGSPVQITVQVRLPSPSSCSLSLWCGSTSIPFAPQIAPHSGDLWDSRAFTLAAGTCIQTSFFVHLRA
ncbi:hypothetical protein C8R43DRAFT_523482 [Mycena crocata]|nr:hypothetical protein C8R43DRAFT_523482 [Mycena crocata]